MEDLQVIKQISIDQVAKDLGFEISRSGTARCKLPGHNDHNPSFSIRKSTNQFRCFACGEAGSVIDLVMLMEGLRFPDAIKWLRKNYLGTTYRAPTPKKISLAVPKVVEVIEPDYEVFRWLIDFSPLRKSGYSYLTSRGFSEDTLRYFEIGQIASAHTTLNAARAKWGMSRLIKSGLVRSGSERTSFAFRDDAILFPFFSSGKIAYIQARLLHGDTRWLCLNGLPSPLFNIRALEQPGVITFCEGATDALSAYELDKNPVAILGANSPVSPADFELFRGRRVEIVTDSDGAGRSLSKRLEAALVKYGANVWPLRLPAGINDLNDYLLSKKEKK